MPENIQFYIGDYSKPLDKNDIIYHVKKRDKIGKDFVRLQIEYIKFLVKGF
jgi:hypothetical protein